MNSGLNLAHWSVTQVTASPVSAFSGPAIKSLSDVKARSRGANQWLPWLAARLVAFKFLRGMAKTLPTTPTPSTSELLAM